MESSLFVGNPLQTSGAQTIQFLEGKAAGLKMIRMYNEAGLSMLVAPDRGMDIPELKVHGTNISFVSVTGFVNSTYFVEQGATGFMRNFNVGFLTTGGLSYMGAPKDPARGYMERLAIRRLKTSIIRITVRPLCSGGCKRSGDVRG